MSDPVDRDRPHDEAEALLPWYATGQLEPADRLVVERHLSSCPECREQLGIERRLIQEFRGCAPEVDAGWARLRQRIEPRPDGRATSRHLRSPRLNFVRRPAIAALAAAQLAIVVIGGGWIWSLSRPSYHALGSASSPAAANAIIIFRPTATEEDLRTTLKSAGASIVEGPTDADAYLLHLPPEKRRQLLNRLQSDNDVQMAQPIDGRLQ
jgi:anti-sigma factor RsiW